MLAPIRHALRPAFTPRFQTGINSRLSLIRQASTHASSEPEPRRTPDDEDDPSIPDLTPEQLEKELRQALKNKEIAEQTLARDAQDPGVIEKYGWYPFIGFGLTALFGKELIILSPANLLGTYSLVAIGVGWLLFGDTAKKAAVAVYDQEKQQQEDMMEAIIELTKAEIAMWKTKGIEANLLEQYRVESAAINEKWVTAQVLKARHALRADMLNRLNDVFSREQTELAQAQAKMINDAIAYVRNKFAKRDAKTDQETIEFALLGLGEDNVKLPKDRDPVRKAFVEFFKSRGIGK